MKVTKIERRARKERGPSVVYVWPAGETVWDNIANRRQRPYTIYKQLLAPHLAEIGLKDGERLAWNQRAGCKCPCSPGFNVRGTGPDVAPRYLHDETWTFYDVHVTVEE